MSKIIGTLVLLYPHAVIAPDADTASCWDSHWLSAVILFDMAEAGYSPRSLRLHKTPSAVTAREDNSVRLVLLIPHADTAPAADMP